MVISSDNNAAISIAKSDAVTQLNKHFDILHHWIRDSVKTKWYDIQRVDTKDQPADIFTKNLSAALVNTHRTFVLGL